MMLRSHALLQCASRYSVRFVAVLEKDLQSGIEGSKFHSVAQQRCAALSQDRQLIGKHYERAGKWWRALDGYLDLAQLKQKHSEVAKSSCWFCGELLYVDSCLICSNCGNIQEIPKHVDFFALFGMAISYHVDLQQLQKTFQKKQMLVHPDKHASKGESSVQLAESMSSHLNKAYQILRSPLERAKYMLKLEGEQLLEEQRIEDQGFLMQIMELREEVDSAKDRETVLSLLEENERRWIASEQSFHVAFEAGNFAMARQVVYQLTYWSRMKEALVEKL